ncbi:MAG: MBL fold metallo-hydrolase [Oscillospiraceae bacterium]|nr:MBL fold metallo-hydrolase [Oscillospiraceae bacterium]
MHLMIYPLGAYQTNCYLVGHTEGECVLIDPGFEAEWLLATMEKLEMKPVAIFLTHGHFDHVGGVKTIAEKTGCPVYIHAAEATLPAEFTAGELYYTHTYGEGDVIDMAGLEFQVLHTPGHTPGSVCLRCGQFLFSGDTLFAGSIGRTDFPGGHWNDIRASLWRLRSLQGDYRVLPGHGEETTLEEERQTNPFLR